MSMNYIRAIVADDRQCFPEYLPKGTPPFINNMYRQAAGPQLFGKSPFVEEYYRDVEIGKIAQGSDQVECHHFGSCPEVAGDEVKNLCFVESWIFHKTVGCLIM